jgi:hexosaminidase
MRCCATLIGLVLGCLAASVHADRPTRVLAMVPKPTKVVVEEHDFVLIAGTTIVVAGESPELSAIAQYLVERIGPATGFRLQIQTQSFKSAPPDAIVLSLDGDGSLGDEGYTLIATSESIRISAHKPAGVFYGVQTLRQLMPAQIESPKRVEGVKWIVPAVTMTDIPRFKWRGLLLDVCRHWRDKEFVKRYIDVLAYHKMNVLHWHLTEDQGWRIDVKKYPRLTEIGAWRDDGRGGKYGGFYTQDDIREIVAYAKSRYITVVPEIEMPGHSTAALAAYPQYSCAGGPFAVATKWGVFEDVYCAGNDATFEFLEDVLSEVLELFPSRFIHIGGDEAPKDRWQACAKCQARIKTENLKDEHELQSWFIRRIDRFLTSKNRRLVGWDEILEGGLAPGATVQSWRGMDGAVAAATAGHDTIVSPTSHCYLDYSYEKISTEKSYSFEPVPAQLTAEQARHVLGLEANMWAERTPLPADTDRQVWPRLCALSEVGWSDPAERTFEEFSKRLEVHLQRLKLMGVQYGGGEN